LHLNQQVLASRHFTIKSLFHSLQELKVHRQ